MSFRRSKKVLREASGTYVNGVWSAGARSVVTTLASAQPVSLGRDMQSLPEGRHLSDYIKLYSSNLLNVTKDGEGSQPDIIVHEGYGYELIDVDKNQSGVIPHYKYIGVKVFKYTTDSDWTTGVTKRP